MHMCGAPQSLDQLHRGWVLTLDERGCDLGKPQTQHSRALSAAPACCPALPQTAASIPAAPANRSHNMRTYYHWHGAKRSQAYSACTLSLTCVRSNDCPVLQHKLAYHMHLHAVSPLFAVHGSDVLSCTGLDDLGPDDIAHPVALPPAQSHVLSAVRTPCLQARKALYSLELYFLGAQTSSSMYADGFSCGLQRLPGHAHSFHARSRVDSAACRDDKLQNPEGPQPCTRAALQGLCCRAQPH